MIPNKFEYHAPSTSIDEAIGLLVQHGEEAKVMSGGHSLIPLLKTRIAQPGFLIDIGRIEDLAYIQEDGDVCRIGACTTHYAIESSDVLKGLLSVAPGSRIPNRGRPGQEQGNDRRKLGPCGPGRGLPGCGHRAEGHGHGGEPQRRAGNPNRRVLLGCIRDLAGSG